MQKFVAVVVLYNPVDDVIKNVESYNDAVSKVYAIDNSDIKNYGLVAKLKQIPNLEYTFLGNNKGIARALNIALCKAIYDNADFLLTMDQDTSFYSNNAEKMISYVSKYKKNDKVVLYAANTDDYQGERNCEYVNLALTSGNIIHCRTIESIGGFDENLFIDWVDQDLCYRLLSAGFKMVRLNHIKINHHLGVNCTKKLLGMGFNYTTHSSVRYYYMVRNKLYVLEKNRVSWKKRTRFIFGVVAMALKVIMIEKNKRNKLYYILQGITDYLRNKMGKFEDV